MVGQGGQIVRADARLSDLAATTDVFLVLASDARGARADLAALPGVEAVEVETTADGPAYRIRGAEGADLRGDVYDLAREKGWALRELRRDVRTLETVFNELATSAGEQEMPAEEAAA